MQTQLPCFGVGEAVVGLVWDASVVGHFADPPPNITGMGLINYDRGQNKLLTTEGVLESFLERIFRNFYSLN